MTDTLTRAVDSVTVYQPTVSPSFFDGIFQDVAVHVVDLNGHQREACILALSMMSGVSEYTDWELSDCIRCMLLQL